MNIPRRRRYPMRPFRTLRATYRVVINKNPPLTKERLEAILRKFGESDGLA